MTVITEKQKTEFYQGFVTAMLWSTGGETPPTLESLEGLDLAPVTEQNLRAHCDKWIAENAALLAIHADVRDLTQASDGASVWELAGHDFWLTCAGHGVGFWDRGLGALGDHLTKACEQFENMYDAYVGDDGLVYVSGMESEPADNVRIAWEIDIELAPGETFDDAVKQAVDIAHDQFARAKGADNGATRPALTVEGELFDLEEYPELGGNA